MRVEPMSEGVGAIVTELPADLTHLAPAEADAIREAFDEHALVLLRGREISLDEQFAVCGLLGTLVDQASNGTTTFNITNRGSSSTSALCFHADFTNAPAEGLLTGASLYGAVLPDEPTETVYAHAGKALAEMPADLRERTRGRRAIHSNAAPGYKTESPARHQPNSTAEPRAEHPIEFIHPRTGRPFMMISDLNTERVVGLDDDASVKLLDELNAWLQEPQFVYHHVWQLHDLVIWDNLVMQHSRGQIGHMGERTLRRVPFTHPEWFEKCQAFFGSESARRAHGAGARM